jgi:hypothetical protein
MKRIIPYEISRMFSAEISWLYSWCDPEAVSANFCSGKLLNIIFVLVPFKCLLYFSLSNRVTCVLTCTDHKALHFVISKIADFIHPSSGPNIFPLLCFRRPTCQRLGGLSEDNLSQPSHRTLPQLWNAPQFQDLRTGLLALRTMTQSRLFNCSISKAYESR